MAGRRLEALSLADDERAELTALAARPKTAQAVAMRVQIVLACAGGLEHQTASCQLGVHAMTVGKWRRRFPAQRIEGLRNDPRPARRARSTTSGSRRSSPTRWSASRRAPRIGVRAECLRAEAASAGTSNSPPIPILSPRCATSSGCIVHPRSMPLCSAWRKNRRSRRSPAARRSFRCGLASRSGAAMTTPDMARHRCSPPSTSPRGR